MKKRFQFLTEFHICSFKFANSFLDKILRDDSLQMEMKKKIFSRNLSHHVTQIVYKYSKINDFYWKTKYNEECLLKCNAQSIPHAKTS